MTRCTHGLESGCVRCALIAAPYSESDRRPPAEPAPDLMLALLEVPEAVERQRVLKIARHLCGHEWSGNKLLAWIASGKTLEQLLAAENPKPVN